MRRPGEIEDVKKKIHARANRGGIHIEKREGGGVVKRDVDPYIISVGIEQRKRGGRKFRKR